MSLSKIVLLFSILIIGIQPVDAQTKPKSSSVKPTAKKASHAPAKGPRIKFEKDTVSFGTIKEDAVIEKNFVFTNTGTEPLVVISATGSCGCTVPTIPSTPIEPGEKGTIIVKYTAKNKVGRQAPLITVITNGYPRTKKISLQGDVEQIPGGVKDN